MRDKQDVRDKQDERDKWCAPGNLLEHARTGGTSRTSRTSGARLGTSRNVPGQAGQGGQVEKVGQPGNLLEQAETRGTSRTTWEPSGTGRHKGDKWDKGDK